MRRIVALAVLLAVGMLALPPAAGAIARKQAVAKAARVLDVKGERGRVVLFGFRRPLKAGSTVGEAGRGGGSVRRVRSRAWVFWLDRAYNARFAHAGRLLALDARSGRVLLRRATTWFPIANDRLVPWLLTARGYLGRRYKALDRSWPGRRSRATAAAYPRIQPRPGQFDRDCVVTIGDFSDPQFAGDLRAINKWADAVGMKRRNARPSAGGLLEAVDAVKREGCRDVLVYLDGHGTPPTRDDFPPGEKELIHLGDRTVAAGAIKGGPPAVMVQRRFRRAPGGRVRDDSEYITPANLIDIFRAHSDITFKLKVDSCFSARFGTVFTASDNLLIAEFSSAFNETSFSNIPRGARVRELAPGTRRRTGRTLVDLTDNPDRAGEFTNGNVHGLFDWATNAPAGETFVDALEQSFERGAKFDFARTAGFTHPVVRRRRALLTSPVATFDPTDANELFVRGRIDPGTPASSSPVTAVTVTVPRSITNFVCPGGLPAPAFSTRSIPNDTLTCSGAGIPVGSSYELKLRTSPAPAAGMGGSLLLRQDGADVGPFSIRGPG